MSICKNQEKNIFNIILYIGIKNQKITFRCIFFDFDFDIFVIKT